MGFLGVYTAIYNYLPQAEGELELREGDLLYILDKGEDDDWWKAKKKAEREDDDEPEGLVPNNYVEEVRMSEVPRQFLTRSPTLAPMLSCVMVRCMVAAAGPHSGVPATPQRLSPT